MKKLNITPSNKFIDLLLGEDYQDFELKEFLGQLGFITLLLLFASILS